jgi:hypothetical protein
MAKRVEDREASHDPGQRPNPLLARPWFVFAVALSLRLLAIAVLQSWQFPAANGYWAAGWETGRIADHLARGDGFAIELGEGWDALAPTAWLAPLYPSLLGGLFALFGSFSSPALIAILALQALLSAATAAQLASLGRDLDRPLTGLLAAWVFALSPASINTAARIVWSTTALTLCAVLITRSYVSMLRAPDWTRGLRLGLLVGISLLLAPTLALFVAVGAALVLLLHKRLAVIPLSIATTTAILLITPWVLRNHEEFGEVFFLKSNFGNELYLGNNPAADGRYRPVRPMAEQTLSAEQLAALQPLNERARASALGAHARSWIAEHPLRFAQLTASRAHTFWRERRITDWQRMPLGPLRPMTERVYGYLHDLQLALAAIGLILLCRSGPAGYLILAFLLTYPLPYYVTHSDISRYRFPVLPFLVLASMLPVAAVLPKLRVYRGRHRPRERSTHA